MAPWAGTAAGTCPDWLGQADACTGLREAAACVGSILWRTRERVQTLGATWTRTLWGRDPGVRPGILGPRAGLGAWGQLPGRGWYEGRCHGFRDSPRLAGA